MLHLSEFVLRSSVLVVFNNFLFIDAKDRSKISRDQKRFLIVLSLYPISFFANTPFKGGLIQRGIVSIPVREGEGKLLTYEREGGWQAPYLGKRRWMASSLPRKERGEGKLLTYEREGGEQPPYQ